MAGEPPSGGPGSSPSGGEQKPQQGAAPSWVQVARARPGKGKVVRAVRVTAEAGWPKTHGKQQQERWMDEDEDEDENATEVLRVVWRRPAAGEGWEQVEADAREHTKKVLGSMGIGTRGLSDPRGEGWDGKLTKMDLLVYLSASDAKKAKQAGGAEGTGMYIEERRRRKEDAPPLWLKTWSVSEARKAAGPEAAIISNGRGVGLVMEEGEARTHAADRAREAGLLVEAGGAKKTKYDLHCVPRGVTAGQVQEVIRTKGWEGAEVLRMIPKKGKQLAIIQAVVRPPFGEVQVGENQMPLTEAWKLQPLRMVVAKGETRKDPNENNDTKYSKPEFLCFYGKDKGEEYWAAADPKAQQKQDPKAQQKQDPKAQQKKDPKAQQKGQKEQKHKPQKEKGKEEQKEEQMPTGIQQQMQKLEQIIKGLQEDNKKLRETLKKQALRHRELREKVIATNPASPASPTKRQRSGTPPEASPSPRRRKAQGSPKKNTAASPTKRPRSVTPPESRSPTPMETDGTPSYRQPTKSSEGKGMDSPQSQAQKKQKMHTHAWSKAYKATQGQCASCKTLLKGGKAAVCTLETCRREQCCACIGKVLN